MLSSLLRKRSYRCLSNTAKLCLLPWILLSPSKTTIYGMSIATNKMERKVAIIGGGIAGLSCANHLLDNNESGFDVCVYDTGRLRSGGRCSSRQSGDSSKKVGSDTEFPLLRNYLFDHAAQLISLPEQIQRDNPQFHNQVQKWLQKGVIQEFPPKSVCQIVDSNTKSKVGSEEKSAPLVQSLNGQKYYHGTNGMSGLAIDMVQETAQSSSSFELKQDVWVSPSSGVKYQKETGKWKVQAKGKILGYYDDIVIAHNGKCADRLMSKSPAKDVHSLLRVNFAPTVPLNGGKKMTLNSIYSLTVVVSSLTSPLSKALSSPSSVAFVKNHPSLSMLTCQTRKYPQINEVNNDHEVWTILSSAKFAKKYKGPQEFLPEETIELVSSLLLKAVQKCLGIDETASIEVLEKRLQLWGAAVPLNVWNNEKGFIYDGKYNVGVCGDWLVEPSLSGAWTSGRLLANHMLKTSSSSDVVDKKSVGVDGQFERSESVSAFGIAALPKN